MVALDESFKYQQSFYSVSRGAWMFPPERLAIYSIAVVTFHWKPFVKPHHSTEKKTQEIVKIIKIYPPSTVCLSKFAPVRSENAQCVLQDEWKLFTVGGARSKCDQSVRISPRVSDSYGNWSDTDVSGSSKVVESSRAVVAVQIDVGIQMTSIW